MAGHGWRIPQNVEDWMRSLEKRVLSVERRPIIHAAKDLMGPGLASRAQIITDFNSDEASFNGYFHAHLDATHSPNPVLGFMVQTIASDKYGLQTAIPVHDISGALYATGGSGAGGFIRRFYIPGGVTPRIYGVWNAL